MAEEEIIGDMQDAPQVHEEINNEAGNVDAVSGLNELYKKLKEPIPENPSSKYITDSAHQLIDNLNIKRKHDTQLIEEFRQAMEKQTVKMIGMLEQQLCGVYEVQNTEVDAKLQELFTVLNRIAATETDLENFKESLKKLYQEMNLV